MSDNARLLGWELEAKRDHYTMKMSGQMYHADEEEYLADFANSCADGLRMNGWKTEVKMVYEAKVIV